MSTTSTAITHSPHSRTRTVAGWVCSSLVVLFLLFDAVIKLPPIQPVTDTLRQLGFVPTPTLARGLGVMLLAITALYAWPRTARVGALLLAAYLGGAIAVQLRAGTPVFSHLLFGVYLGVLAMIGLCLRDRGAWKALIKGGVAN